ncbi:striatin isoform X3 [Corvus cornix cornix]|nr:striatin isoform X3 [Corvus moneduloides]XP_039424341.1 striatin isoform X3 [Corvus cornix cornix]XP_041877930.1 striatin isoform X3 [Corvus kubaryi]XP_048154712.1 striatin isoform X3 [Corvus hawaiiensis]NWY13998.1 STRN protein [Aphelocoma coerulescens]NXD51843.1 STRN protein [Corvus moneduloides]
MDEQAGPGVFFSNNNNNNALLLPPPAGGPGLEPGEAAAAAAAAAAAGGGGGGGGGVSASGAAAPLSASRAQYSVPGILHFLQHEWGRFEAERAEWEAERAELQAQIAFLQGERKGQENLKKDLVRRIKMLEYALKQERAKYHKLKYGTELNQGDMKPPNYDSDEGNETEIQPQQNSQLIWKQGRQLLRQYLQEVGYTDTILDVKSKRVRALLGLSSDASEKENRNQEPMVNGTEGQIKENAMIGKPELTDSASLLETFKFLENAAADFSDEEDEEDIEGREKTIIDTATIVRKRVLSDSSEDRDTEEALKEFDFLVTSDDGDGESRSSGDGTDWEKEDQCLMPEAWNVDQGVITKLKEQYKKERKGKKGVKRPNRSKLQDMLANLRDVDDLPSLQPSVAPSSRPSSSRLIEHEINRTDEVEALTFPPSSGKSFIMGTDEALENELGLGELAGLTVANEADSLTYDIANNKDALRKTWNPKFTLRSHFDGIRGLAFHPVEPVLITASEDHTLKMWNLQKTAPAKKSASLDVEPIYTFRAHNGPVLCVVMSSNGEQCYSGGTDGLIHGWNTTNPNIDPYDSYDPSVLRGAFVGHTDAVWGLVYSGAHQRLLSCSADGTIRLWKATEIAPALNIFNDNQEMGIPSSVDLVSSDPSLMVASFNSGHTSIFNMETRQRILTLESSVDTTVSSSCQINRVISHPTLPISITAHEDRHIKFYDNNTGKLIHSMVAHLDAVTSLAVDPNGLYLMSGSHDCSIRLWNLESKTCIQEFTAHRKKFDESIHDVAFHPSKCYIASAGADALAKVFV